MHRPQLVTWTTHTAENTTLLDYKKLYTYMCNIVTELVTEFYLYSIVYIYLINSRLDVTHSVRHHFRTATLSSTRYYHYFAYESSKATFLIIRLINLTLAFLNPINFFLGIGQPFFCSSCVLYSRYCFIVICCNI